MPCDIVYRVVGESVTRNADFLWRLARCRSPVKRLEMLRNASKDQLLALAEIALNILKERFPISDRQRAALIPFADPVRKLSRARSESGARKTVLIGGGMFVAPLTRTVLLKRGCYGQAVSADTKGAL
jgi:hypothetical protein